MTLDSFLSFWGHHLIMAGIWMTLALSLNLINGTCGLFSLGHQGFWLVGAYTAAATVSFWPDGGLAAVLLSVPLAVLSAGLAGLLVGVPCLRLRGDYLAIATLGFSEILRNVVQNSETLGSSLGLSWTNPLRSAFGSNRTGYMLLMLGVSALTAGFTALVMSNLKRSAHGRAIRAVRDDDRVAELLGVNLTRYKVLVFAIGAALAGLAGAVFANYNAQVTPEDFTFNTGVLIVVMVVLGGMGSYSGTALATLLLYFAPVLLALLLPSTRIPVFYDPTQGGVVYRELKDLWQVLFAIVLIAVVLVRPEGILGNWRRLSAQPAPPQPPVPPGPPVPPKAPSAGEASA